MLYRNTAGYIDASMVVIATGAALTAGTVYAYVQRKSDAKWLNADTTWTVGKPVGAAIPVMTHVSGGLWQLAHTPADADDTYMVNCIDSGATCYPDNYALSVLKGPVYSGVRKNTLVNNFEFLMISSADHVTPKTGLAPVIATRSIDGAVFASCANLVAEVGAGMYKINLAASDLNGDIITLVFTAAGADQRTIVLKTTL